MELTEGLRRDLFECRLANTALQASVTDLRAQLATYRKALEEIYRAPKDVATAVRIAGEALGHSRQEACVCGSVADAHNPGCSLAPGGRKYEAERSSDECPACKRGIMETGADFKCGACWKAAWKSSKVRIGFDLAVSGSDKTVYYCRGCKFRTESKRDADAHKHAGEEAT